MGVGRGCIYKICKHQHRSQVSREKKRFQMGVMGEIKSGAKPL